MRPFTIKLFVPSGNPNGVLVASRDDWPGRAVIFPRALIGEVRGRKEFNQPGVYILVGKNKMYVGEGDPVGTRLDDHVKKKDFWTRAIFFTAESGRLNKAHIQHLESKLHGVGKEVSRVTVENIQNPGEPVLSEEDRAFANGFFQEILNMLPSLGFNQFIPAAVEAGETNEPGESSNEDAGVVGASGKRAELYASLPQGMGFKLTSKGISAELEVTEGGVIVKKGSQVVNPPSATFEANSPSYAALRQQLVESGILSVEDGKLVFSSDQFFTSASAAATVVRGNNANAEWWKASDGKTLGDYIREVKAKS